MFPLGRKQLVTMYNRDLKGLASFLQSISLDLPIALSKTWEPVPKIGLLLAHLFPPSSPRLSYLCPAEQILPT